MPKNKSTVFIFPIDNYLPFLYSFFFCIAKIVYC